MKFKTNGAHGFASVGCAGQLLRRGNGWKEEKGERIKKIRIKDEKSMIKLITTYNEGFNKKKKGPRAWE